MAKWKVPGFTQGWGCSVNPRFHLFVSDVNLKIKKQDGFKDFLRGSRDRKTHLRSYTRC